MNEIKKEILISIKNLVARCQDPNCFIVCGNKKYEAVFDFDSEWDEHEKKTARFKWNGGYKEVEFKGNRCPIPAVSNTHILSVGVYVDGLLETSTPCLITCTPSILCGNDTLNTNDEINGIPKNAHIRYSAYADGTDFTEEWSEGQRYIGFATAQTPPLNKDEYIWSEFIDEGVPVLFDKVGGCTFETTITADGTTSRYTVSKDNNGNPLNLDEVYIWIGQGATGGYDGTWINGTRVSYRHGKGSNYYEAQRFTRVGNSLWGVITSGTYGGIDGMNFGTRAGGIYHNFLNGKKINSIGVGGEYGGIYPAGTKIIIMGR